jgi:gamma-glutamyl-gamma-aminobutyrate hydrolase PuuD
VTVLELESWQLLLTNGNNLKIAVTQRVLYHKGRAYDSLEHGWYRFLKDHTLIFIPNRTDQDFKSLADSVDALIITGGDDSAIRRTTELKLASIMMQQFKPIVGVCHGAFLLTDVLGGIVSQCDGHMDVDHVVDYFGQQFNVNSYHSQSIKKLHSTAQALVHDTDGDCEAWIDRNLAGIVWHPERMIDPWVPCEILNQLVPVK